MKRIILTLFLFFNYIFLNAYTISGYTNLLDSPIEGAALELYGQQPHMGFSPVDITSSDENGFYTFDIADPGMYYVAAIIQSPVYQMLFYDNESYPSEATSILVNNMNPNLEEINFDFQSNIIPGDNSIFGSITDLTATPVAAAEIAVFPVQYNHPWMTPFFTVSQSDGTYIIENLPDGEYLLYVNHPAYLHYYYNGVPSWPQAEVIILENGNAIEIDVILESNDFYMISGYVSDDQTGQPIFGAEVQGFSQNGNHHFGNGPGGGNLMPVAITDENGYYQLFIPNGIYHVLAIDPVTKDVEFYDNASTPLTATWIVVDQNISGIDFVLNDNLGGDYTISGNISISGGNYEPIILAVAVSSDEDWEEAVMTDGTGGYEIPSLPGGSYYVYGFSPSTVPTYFEDAISYEEAILVDLQSSVTGIDIMLHEPLDNGYLECTGLVIDNLGNPVSNATVAFLDSFGNIHDYAYSDDNGEYQVPFLGSLNYTALATKTFYSTDSTQLPVYGNQTLDFIMIAPNTDAEQNVISLNKNIDINIYPNPFNPQTAIQFTLPEFSNNTEITIFNLKGQKVFRKTLQNLTSGSYTVSWQAKDMQEKPLGSGIYFLKVSTKFYSGTGKLLLLK